MSAILNPLIWAIVLAPSFLAVVIAPFVEKLPSWPHQVRAREWALQHWALKHYGLLFACDMGTGKTKLALDLAYLCGATCLLILCPMRVVEVWEYQLALHAVFPYVFAGLDDRVNSTERKAGIARDVLARARAMRRVAVIAVNYEAFRLDPLASLLRRTPWSMLIADECHRLGSASGKQSRAAAKVPAAIKIGMTGTPLTQSPDSAYGIMRAIDRWVFPSTHAEFLLEFAKKGGFMGKEIKEWINMERFNQLLYSRMFRVEAKDVLDLPPESDQHFHFTLCPNAQRIYAELEAEFIAWLNDTPEDRLTIQNVMTLLLRLAQLTGGTLRDDRKNEHRVDTGKEKLLADWLNDLDPQEKVVVFARFHSDLDAIERASVAAGRECAEMSGRISRVREWKEGKATVLAAQIQSAGEGQDFTLARYAAYYSMGFSRKDYVQSRKRLHRPGQTRAVVYYHLHARNTVDERILRAVENRCEFIESVIKEIRPQCNLKTT